MKYLHILAAAWLLAPCAVLAANQTGDHAAFEGMWHLAKVQTTLRTLDGKAPPLITAKSKTDDTDRCLPHGVPRLYLSGAPFYITVGHTMVGEAFETDHSFRLIYINKPHFDVIAPAYLGQAVAVWKGGHLLVDVNQFNDVTWLDDSGLPHSDKLHLTEDMSIGAGGKLHDLITVTDPTDYSTAWQTELTFSHSSQTTLSDTYCLHAKGLL